MNTVFTFAALALAVSAVMAATPARAGEGAGDPFAFRTPAQVTSGAPFIAETSSEAYPMSTGNTVRFSSLADLLPVNGSEGVVQTAQSMPKNADEGTVAYAQAERVNQAMAHRTIHTRLRVTEMMQPRG